MVRKMHSSGEMSTLLDLTNIKDMPEKAHGWNTEDLQDKYQTLLDSKMNDSFGNYESFICSCCGKDTRDN